MRTIRKLIVHCSATRVGLDIGAKEIDAWHRKPPFNFDCIGYHLVIRRDGRAEFGRPLERVGAHCKGANADSIGVCLVGGLTEVGTPGRYFSETFTPYQDHTLRAWIDAYGSMFPGLIVEGHRDQSPDLNNDGIITPDEWMKQCPTFDVREWLRSGK